jgi:DNA-binding response OmpR family regulator
MSPVATVLIVEDNADLREMYQEILAMSGHATSLAENAGEAITELAASRAEVVVLDLGIAGPVPALIDAVRAAGARIVVASGAKDLAERAAALGAAAYLVKPFSPELLSEAVTSAAKR